MVFDFGPLTFEKKKSKVKVLSSKVIRVIRGKNLCEDFTPRKKISKPAKLF
jgi:hypothetical protein